MAQTSTLHIKIDPDLAKGLKALAERRRRSVSDLVRHAVSACYQVDLLDLPETQRRALAAYQGGYISLGKLAEALGMTPVATMRWLQEHDIPQNTVFEEDDTASA